MSRSMVASVTIEDTSGRTTLYGSAEPVPAPVSEPKGPGSPEECSKRRRVKCERCLRYAGGPNRVRGECPFGMGTREELDRLVLALQAEGGWDVDLAIRAEGLAAELGLLEELKEAGIV